MKQKHLVLKHFTLQMGLFCVAWCALTSCLGLGFPTSFNTHIKPHVLRHLQSITSRDYGTSETRQDQVYNRFNALCNRSEVAKLIQQC